jgi:hypothetical protein
VLEVRTPQIGSQVFPPPPPKTRLNFIDKIIWQWWLLTVRTPFFSPKTNCRSFFLIYNILGGLGTYSLNYIHKKKGYAGSVSLLKSKR